MVCFGPVGQRVLRHPPPVLVMCVVLGVENHENQVGADRLVAFFVGGLVVDTSLALALDLPLELSTFRQGDYKDDH